MPWFSTLTATRALEPTYRKVLVSSLWIAGLATAIALLLGYPVAYAVSSVAVLVLGYLALFL